MANRTAGPRSHVPAAGCDPAGTIRLPVPGKLRVMALFPSGHTMLGSFLP